MGVKIRNGNLYGRNLWLQAKFSIKNFQAKNQPLTSTLTVLSPRIYFLISDIAWLVNTETPKQKIIAQKNLCFIVRLYPICGIPCDEVVRVKFCKIILASSIIKALTKWKSTMPTSNLTWLSHYGQKLTRRGAKLRNYKIHELGFGRMHPFKNSFADRSDSSLIDRLFHLWWRLSSRFHPYLCTSVFTSSTCWRSRKRDGDSATPAFRQWDRFGEGNELASIQRIRSQCQSALHADRTVNIAVILSVYVFRRWWRGWWLPSTAANL